MFKLIRALYNTLPWPSWAVALAPDYTLFMPVTTRSRSIYDTLPTTATVLRPDENPSPLISPGSLSPFMSPRPLPPTPPPNYNTLSTLSPFLTQEIDQSIHSGRIRRTRLPSSLTTLPTSSSTPQQQQTMQTFRIGSNNSHDIEEDYDDEDEKIDIQQRSHPSTLNLNNNHNHNINMRNNNPNNHRSNYHGVDQVIRTDIEGDSDVDEDTSMLRNSQENHRRGLPHEDLEMGNNQL